MKKLKVIFGIALACALALSCLAFTACGSPLEDGTFNIDTTKQATDAELKTFNENVAAANKTTGEGINEVFENKSFKVATNVSMSMDQSGIKMGYAYKLEGIVNATKEPTAKLKGDVDMSVTATGVSESAKGTVEMTLVSNTIYMLTKSGESTEKYKFDISSLGNIGGLVPNSETSVYATTDETAVSVEEFLQDIKDAFTSFGMTVSPKLYINGGVMKIQLTDENHLGIAYDNDWHIKGVDVVLKGADLSATIGVNIKFDIEFAMRAANAETVTTPSDAKDYKDYLDFSGGLDGLL